MYWRALSDFGRTYDPFAEFRGLQREINRLFTGGQGRNFEFPGLNVWANDDETVVTAEVPGVSPEDIKVTVTGDTVTLEGERKPLELTDEEVYQRRERGTGAFARSLKLPFHVEHSRVEALARNGVLTVRLPRRRINQAPQGRHSSRIRRAQP